MRDASLEFLHLMYDISEPGRNELGFEIYRAIVSFVPEYF